MENNFKQIFKIQNITKFFTKIYNEGGKTNKLLSSNIKIFKGKYRKSK